MIFDLVHNYHEQAVYRAVLDRASAFPEVERHPELLPDVACVALNRIEPRYIRSNVDMAFYMSDEEFVAHQAAVNTAVEFAFDFVSARLGSVTR